MTNGRQTSVRSEEYQKRWSKEEQNGERVIKKLQEPMISSNKEEVAEWTENKKIQNKEEQGVQKTESSHRRWKE